MPFCTAVILTIVTFSTRALYDLKKRRVSFENVINIKGGRNVGAESCTAADPVLVVWVIESTDTFTSALTENMQTPC